MVDLTSLLDSLKPSTQVCFPPECFQCPADDLSNTCNSHRLDCITISIIFILLRTVIWIGFSRSRSQDKHWCARNLFRKCFQEKPIREEGSRKVKGKKRRKGAIPGEGPSLPELLGVLQHKLHLQVSPTLRQGGEAFILLPSQSLATDNPWGI